MPARAVIGAWSLTAPGKPWLVFAGNTDHSLPSENGSRSVSPAHDWLSVEGGWHGWHAPRGPILRHSLHRLHHPPAIALRLLFRFLALGQAKGPDSPIIVRRAPKVPTTQLELRPCPVVLVRAFARYIEHPRRIVPFLPSNC